MGERAIGRQEGHLQEVGEGLSQEGPSFRGAAYRVHRVRSQQASQFTDVLPQDRGVQEQAVKVQPEVPVVPGSEVEMPAPRAGEGDQGTCSHSAIVGFRVHSAFLAVAAAPAYTEPMPPKPLSAEYFDGWYADQAAMPAVAEIMNRHMGFPPGTRAGVIAAEAIPELTQALRLRPGRTLLDLACGRAAYGLLVAKHAGTPLIGVDFSAQALTEAREQAARLGVSDATFRTGELVATGLPDASVEAVLCTDAIQFPDEPAAAYDEIRRVLRPGGRVALTCWEPFDRADERLSLRLRRANLAAGLGQAGFIDVEVRERPSWLAREHALWEEAAALDPGDDPALRSLHDEAVRSLRWAGLLRRVLAVATSPR
jgi:SAM-dependent methyltransferase